jgi:hypothetical protein
MLTRLSRAVAGKIAAGIALVVALFAIVASDLPGLIGGADAFPYPYPYWWILGSFASDILALVAAYGAWQTQKWGLMLLILINLFWLFQAISTMLLAADTGSFVVGVVGLFLHLVTIVLCLWREPVPR